MCGRRLGASGEGREERLNQKLAEEDVKEQGGRALRRRLRGPGTLEPELDAETKRTELEKEESEPVEDVYKWVETYRWKASTNPAYGGSLWEYVTALRATVVVLVCGRQVCVGGCMRGVHAFV